MVNRLGSQREYFPDWAYRCPSRSDHFTEELDVLKEARQTGRDAVEAVLQRNHFIISVGGNCDMSPTHATLYRALIKAAQDFQIDTDRLIDWTEE